ncbi:NUDIX domain-containing protein [Paraburkholderia rhizosphaerae]|uniref:ADP-ribose pyrophosphatase YjhB (NUDIX family) n=1 Tax=Paraburkholderia rhizosphaerae TaxID=480658 RepID=A0A4R8LVY3_9BURK|nr:NUDIX domain-containing protein [Paraburkholderia rhizosphaerae]TDY50846.1 ADP-ribose pyrophosphatase YjhB (NUDIX family) [Paraburkholderia rhizosphaerae]
MPFKSLDAAAIEASLSGETRQYLAGALKRPQPLVHIADADIEVGISHYEQSGFEPAHRHARAKEYQYVLCGMTEYQDLDTGEVHRFRSGDFYVIYPGTAYVQRIKRDTRILFFKYPAGNDKESVPMTRAIDTWAREALRVTRVDLNAGGGRAGADAQPVPAANSLKPAVAVAVFDAASRLLLVKRRDSGYWAMPGGTMELTDSLEGCARREVREETGVEITITGMVGTYTDPATIIVYTDGEVRREFSILLAASSVSEHLSHDDESTDVQWVDLDGLARFPMVVAQARRVQDVLAWRSSRAVFIR